MEGKLVGGGRSTSGKCPDGCCPAGGDLGPGWNDGFPRCLGLTLFSSLPWVKLTGVNRSHKWGIWNKKIILVKLIIYIETGLNLLSLPEMLLLFDWPACPVLYFDFNVISLEKPS